MRFGLCTNLLPRIPGSVGEEYLPVLAELGYDYVELPLGDLTTVLNTERRRKLGKLLQDTLPVYSCNNFFTNNIKLCGPAPTPFVQIEDYYKRALETAASFDVSIAVFGSPWSKFCPDGFPREEAFRQLTEICSALGDEARKYGIIIAIEPNNRLETNMIDTYPDVLKLIHTVDHPNIQGLQDYFHLKQEKVTVDSLIEGGDHLVHTHFACYEGRRFPRSSSEDTYYNTYFDTLAKIGYNGGISMEGLTKSPDTFREDAEAALAFFRTMTRR